MAHIFGKNSTRTSSAGNPITTASFTIASDETVLVLMLNVQSGTSRAGGAPTFAGRTMTQANSTQKAVTSPEVSAELWYLINPPVGSWTCTIPNTGALTIFFTLATGKAKAGGRSAFDVASGSNNTSTNPTPGSVTTTEDGDIGFAIVATGAQTWAPSAQAGTVIANTDDGATGGGEQVLQQSTRAAIDLNWTFATSDDWGAVAVFFKEVSPTNINNYMGIKSSGMSVGELIR